MAIIANPRKVFNFVIEINGFDQFEAQNVTFPDVEIDETKHGEGNREVKTPGKIKVGDMVVEALKPMPTTDRLFWDWIGRVQNMKTGGGTLPSAHQQIVVLKEMDSTGFVTINRWLATEVWPKKYAQSKWDRMSSDNLMKMITFSVGTIELIP